MNLKTTYLGLKLRTPLVVSASPLSESIDNIKRMEDAGASAVVLHSLFEEQIRYERYELHWSTTQGTESYPEADERIGGTEKIKRIRISVPRASHHTEGIVCIEWTL